MNHRQTPRATVAMYRAFHGLILLALPAMVSARTYNGHHHRHGSLACPFEVPPPSYLPAVGAPPLRFQAELIVAIAKVATPSPETTVSGSTERQDLADVSPSNSAKADSSEENFAEPQPGSAPNRGAAKVRLPAPILPDDSRPSVRPEDFLPYFQFPGSGSNAGGVTVIVPVPPSLPTPASQVPSSATYIQTP